MRASELERACLSEASSDRAGEGGVLVAAESYDSRRSSSDVSDERRALRLSALKAVGGDADGAGLSSWTKTVEPREHPADMELIKSRGCERYMVG